MTVNKFILDEAEVDDDAEDDDDDDLEEGFEQLINKDYNEDEEEGTSESFRHQRRLDHLLSMQEEDKLEEYYRLIYLPPPCISHYALILDLFYLCKFSIDYRLNIP